MKQLQKHLIIILVMGIMLAAALIGGISTFTFREISSNDNRAIMKWGVVFKNIDQHLRRHFTIKLYTCHFILCQLNHLFYYDQCSCTYTSHSITSSYNTIQCFIRKPLIFFIFIERINVTK